MKRRKVRHRNPVAKAVRRLGYRIIRSKKIYSRAGQITDEDKAWADEILSERHPGSEGADWSR